MTDSSVHASNWRTGAYIVAVFAAAILGFAYTTRTNGLFACQAPTAGNDQYVGICDVAHFGDYDHGAFWFGLETSAIQAAAEAKVLFLGNSRLQFALSTTELQNWFDARATSFYLLGFSHHETFLFIEPLLARLKPSATFYVLNIDNFFDDRITGPANAVMNEPDSSNRYEQKHFWQAAHQRICGAVAALCGNGLSFIRARDNGSWEFKGADFLAQTDFSDQPIALVNDVDTDDVANFEDRARNFFAAIGAQPGCVVLTNVPNRDTSLGTARALARQLELPLVAPYMDGLLTFDGSHLDPASAARWSQAFIEELAPYVDRCLQGQG